MMASICAFTCEQALGLGPFFRASCEQDSRTCSDGVRPISYAGFKSACCDSC